MGFGRAIVIGPEPMIQRHDGFSVIALEVAVMQMMKITAGTANLEVSLEDQLLEAEMPMMRVDGVVMHVHQHVDGMRRHDPVNQHTAEENNALKMINFQPHRCSGFKFNNFSYIQRFGSNILSVS